MKQLGTTLIAFAALSVISITLKLQGLVWELVFLLLGLGASFFVPQPRWVLALKPHWRIALLIAVICTFVIVWISIRLVLGDYQTYSFPVTLFVFGLLTILFAALDKLASNGGCCLLGYH